MNHPVHRWFANKACPGDYLYSRHGAIADEVNKRLGVTSAPASGMMYRVQVGAFSKKANAEALLARLKAAGFDGFITQTK